MSSASSESLAIIIPVYNEQDAIETVIADWHNTLESLGADFEIHAYNDGSKDQTGQVLKKLSSKFRNLRAHTKLNSGHGPTILQGYLANLNKTWLFQVDSDNELTASGFSDLWKNREKFDFLIGRRDGRHSPLARKIMSLVSRVTVWLLYGRSVWDVNSPYRLMRTEKFAPILRSIPLDTFAPNILIAAEAARTGMAVFETPVAHTNRQTGEVSIKKWKLLKVAFKSFAQTVAFRF